MGRRAARVLAFGWLLWALLACGGGAGEGAAPDGAGAPDLGVRDGAVLDAAPDGAPDASADTGAPDVAPPAGADAHAGADAGGADVPACGSGRYDWRGLLPGPAEPGFDAALAAKAERYERSFRTFSAAATGLNTNVYVSADDVAARAAIETFLRDGAGWDFAAVTGREPLDVITSHGKVAGLYAGIGIAADAFRYAVLRDQGAACADVERARTALLRAVDGLHLAVAITGAEGVIARGFARRDLPGAVEETVPLFDEQGNPLPEPKNNGTWRDDLSGGRYPGWIWEDSVSRDMYIGWVTGFAAAWEVIRADPTIPAAVRERLRADALAVARQLPVVRASGYDLELPDADGRTTLHGWLNEHNFDGVLYLDSFENGFHAVMALGVVAAWVSVTDDPALRAWLHDELIGERDLPGIARRTVGAIVDLGYGSNYSNYNMAFTGFWLALRYLDDPAAVETLRDALATGLYDRPGRTRQPIEQQNGLFDLVYAAGTAGLGQEATLAAEPEPAALERVLGTLRDFRDAPYWDYEVVNCPAAVCTPEDPRVDSPDCTALDGRHLTVLGCVGRNGDLITEEPIPMAIRGPSDYHWRSHPYKPNRGDPRGGTLLPGVDFRFVYWLGRYLRVPAPS